MTGFNSYAAGQKVYNGGSSAAHRGGGLDPIGYIERELNASGGSDQRSGFAAAALARQGAGGFDKGGWGSRGGSKKRKKKKKGSKPGTSPGAVTGNSDNGVPEIEDDNLRSVSTPVISNATGQLSLDPEAMQQLNDAQLAFNNNNAELDNAQARAAQQFASGQRDLGIQQKGDQRQDLNRFSARGMAFSSGYGQEVTDSANMFGNAFSDLTNEYNSVLTGIGNQRTANQNFLGSSRARHAARQAAINAELAAQQPLGLDPGYQAPESMDEPEPTAPATMAPGGLGTPGGWAGAARSRLTGGGKKKKKGYKGSRPGPG